MDEKATPSGVLESLSRLGRNGVELIRNRLELFGVELEEQKVRSIRLLMLAAAAIFLGNTAVLVISATVVILAGERARLGVLIALCVIYLGGAVWAALALRNELRSSPPIFESSIGELKKDAERLTRSVPKQ